MSIHDHSSSTIVPLQAPGGAELFLIALIFLIFVTIAVGIVYLFRELSGPTDRNDGQIEALERRVTELEAKQEAESESPPSEIHDEK